MLAPVEAADQSERIAVYNGRVCLGHYVERAGSWLASDGKAAIDAILAVGSLR